LSVDISQVRDFTLCVTADVITCDHAMRLPKFRILIMFLDCSTVCSNKFEHEIYLFVNHLNGYSEEWLVFVSKHLQQPRLQICIYKASRQDRPENCVGFLPCCPPHTLKQNCAHVFTACV